MSFKWVYVRQHPRKLRDGRIITVREHFVPRTKSKAKPGDRLPNICPMCDAKIHTVRNRNGGWAHYELGLYKYGVRHPCFTLGDGLSAPDPDAMRDLFDKDADAP